MEYMSYYISVNIENILLLGKGFFKEYLKIHLFQTLT